MSALLNKKEIWIDAKGMESDYMVSNLGRIKSKRRWIERKRGGGQYHESKIMSVSREHKDRGRFIVRTNKYGAISVLETMVNSFMEEFNPLEDFAFILDNQYPKLEDVKIVKLGHNEVYFDKPIPLGYKIVKNTSSIFAINSSGNVISRSLYYRRVDNRVTYSEESVIKSTYNERNNIYQYRFTSTVCNVNFGRSVHRIVAETFIPNPNNLPCVNHIDGDRANNNVDNLEWVSYSENLKHAYDVLHRCTNSTSVKKRPCKSINKINNEVFNYESIASASRHTGISETQIRRIIAKECNNERYYFQYI